MQSSRAKFQKTLLSFVEVEKKVQAAQTLQRQHGDQRRRRQRRARLKKERREREKEREKEKEKGRDSAGKAEEAEAEEAEAEADREDGDTEAAEDVAGQDGPAFLPLEHKENWMVRFINANAIGTATLT